MTINIDDLSKLSAETKNILLLRLFEDMFVAGRKPSRQLESLINEVKRECCRLAAESCTPAEREKHEQMKKHNEGGVTLKEAIHSRW